ncbi:unnamed protein product, partial [Discosporangium mesarthrocarpum]
MVCWTCKGNHATADCPHRLRRRVTTVGPRQLGRQHLQAAASNGAASGEGLPSPAPGVQAETMAGHVDESKAPSRSPEVEMRVESGGRAIITGGDERSGPGEGRERDLNAVGVTTSRESREGIVVSTGDSLRRFRSSVGHRLRGASLARAATWQAMEELARIPQVQRGLALLACGLLVWTYDHA